MSQDAYVINDVESLAHSIRKNAALTFTEFQDNLDEYITINQVLEIIYQYSDTTNNGTIILDEDGYNKIFDDVRIRIYNTGLSKLAAKGYVECAWDDETNSMIFWPKDGVYKEG